MTFKGFRQRDRPRHHRLPDLAGDHRVRHLPARAPHRIVGASAPTGVHRTTRRSSRSSVVRRPTSGTARRRRRAQTASTEAAAPATEAWWPGSSTMAPSSSRSVAPAVMRIEVLGARPVLRRLRSATRPTGSRRRGMAIARRAPPMLRRTAARERGARLRSRARVGGRTMSHSSSDRDRRGRGRARDRRLRAGLERRQRPRDRTVALAGLGGRRRHQSARAPAAALRRTCASTRPFRHRRPTSRSCCDRLDSVQNRGAQKVGRAEGTSWSPVPGTNLSALAEHCAPAPARASTCTVRGIDDVNRLDLGSPIAGPDASVGRARSLKHGVVLRRRPYGLHREHGPREGHGHLGRRRQPVHEPPRPDRQQRARRRPARPQRPHHDHGARPEPGGRGSTGLIDLIPRRVLKACCEMRWPSSSTPLWRARRLGRPIAEQQPVAIAGSRLVDAVGRLYRRTGSTASGCRSARRSAPPSRAALRPAGGRAARRGCRGHHAAHRPRSARSLGRGRRPDHRRSHAPWPLPPSSTPSAGPPSLTPVPRADPRPARRGRQGRGRPGGHALRPRGRAARARPRAARGRARRRQDAGRQGAGGRARPRVPSACSSRPTSCRPT